MVTTPSPPQRILLAFSDLSPDAREVVGETLERHPVPFLSALGSSLCHGPKLAEMVLTCALKRVSWDGSASLIDRLSDDEPWQTVKTCVAKALAAEAVAVEGENGKP